MARRSRPSSLATACFFVLVVIVPLTSPAVEPGGAAPAIDTVDASGRVVPSGFMPGKVALVHFWASWCKPCIKELPLLDALAKKLSDRGVVFVAISVDEDRGKAESTHRLLGAGFPLVFDQGGTTAARFDVPTLPTTVVVDRAGIVQLVHAGACTDSLPALERHVISLVEPASPLPTSEPPTSPPSPAPASTDVVPP